MDFAFTAEDEAFRDELRGWLDENLPKFLADWGADDDPGGGQVGRLRPHPGAAQGLAAPARTRAAGRPSTGRRTGTAARPRRCRT